MDPTQAPEGLRTPQASGMYLSFVFLFVCAFVHADFYLLQETPPLLLLSFADAMMTTSQLAGPSSESLLCSRPWMAAITRVRKKEVVLHPRR